MGHQAQAPAPRPDASDLPTARLLCAITMVAYPAFWFADAAAGAEFEDPFWVRIAVSGFCAVLWRGTYRPGWVRAHLRGLMLLLVYSITAHAHFLVAANDLQQSMVVGTFVVLTGFIATAPYTVGRDADITAYLGFTIAGAVIATLVAEAHQTGPGYYILSVVTVSALAFVAVRGQFRTSQRLLRSEQQLQRDVDRRKHTEAALRASEAQASAMLGAVPDLMLRLDGVQTIRAVMGGAHGQLRACFERAVGRPLAEVIGAGDARESLSDAIAIARAGGTSRSVHGQVQLDDCVREVRIPVAPIDDDQTLVLIRDVTDVLAMEAQLRIRDRLISLGTLAGGVAHEVNNPLTYVSVNVDWVADELRERLEDDAPADLLEALEEAGGGCRRIRDIVADLQQHSRAEEDQQGPVDVAEAIQSALRVMDNQIKHRATLDVSMADLPAARANASRLHQIVLNLVGNALQAFPDRPASENVLRITTGQQPDGRLSIDVSDNGDGIPDEIRSRIFDPFFTTKTPGVGTGLGLYLCHKFVHACGGELSVDSAPGRGTTFRIVLNVEGGPERGEHLRDRVSIPERKVLVIDDAPMVARAVARLLRGHAVDVVHDGEEALRLCAEGDYAFILCDLMMPGIDGRGFYERLSESQPHLLNRVIFMSGGAFTAQAQAFLESVPNPCLPKPMDPGTLAEALRRLDLGDATPVGRISLPLSIPPAC